MSNHHHQSKSEQIYNKARGAVPFHHEKMSYETSVPKQSGNTLLKEAADESSIQLLAYQIYCVKGGSALDNWLEAEQIIKNSDSDGFVL